MEKGAIRPVQALKAHLALNVRRMAESLEFYRKMLGIEPSKVRTGYAKFDVANPPLNLTLNEVPFGERGALSHLGIQVASTADVLAVRERWVGEGLITRDEMQTNCCYATQDKTWVHDPDGNEWEVFVVLEDNLPEASPKNTCCVTVQPDKFAAVESAPAVAGSCATAPSEPSAEATSCGCASKAFESTTGVEASASLCCSTTTTPVPLSR